MSTTQQKTIMFKTYQALEHVEHQRHLQLMQQHAHFDDHLQPTIDQWLTHLDHKAINLTHLNEIAQNLQKLYFLEEQLTIKLRQYALKLPKIQQLFSFSSYDFFKNQTEHDLFCAQLNDVYTKQDTITPVISTSLNDKLNLIEQLIVQGWLLDIAVTDYQNTVIPYKKRANLTFRLFTKDSLSNAAEIYHSIPLCWSLEPSPHQPDIFLYSLEQFLANPKHYRHIPPHLLKKIQQKNKSLRFVGYQGAKDIKKHPLILSNHDDLYTRLIKINQ